MCVIAPKDGKVPIAIDQSTTANPHLAKTAPHATIKAATTLATVCPGSKERSASSTSTIAPTILVITAELVTIKSTDITVPVLMELKDFSVK
jgi:hypothetical protein